MPVNSLDYLGTRMVLFIGIQRGGLCCPRLYPAYIIITSVFPLSGLAAVVPKSEELPNVLERRGRRRRRAMRFSALKVGRAQSNTAKGTCKTLTIIV